MNRCKWCNLDNLLYVKYHDEEWGVLNTSDAYLFEDTSKGSLGSSGNHNRGNNNTKNPFSKEHYNLTEQSRLYLENPTLAKQLEELAKK